MRVTFSLENPLITIATYPSAKGRKGQNRWAKAFVSKGENERSPPTFIRGKRQKNEKDCGF